MTEKRPTGDSAAREPASITIYGRRSVLEAFDAESVEVIKVRVAKEIAGGGDFRKQLSAAARARGIEIEQATLREVGEASGDMRNDQGVVARIRLKKVMEVEQFIDTLKGPGAKAPAHVIALDNVTNPQNVGMIVRSALAAGMSAMLWPTVGGPWVNGLIIKASAATVYRMPIVKCYTLAEGLGALKVAGFKAAGLMASGATSLFDHVPHHRAAAVVGGETAGISPEVMEMLDARVSIPMAAGVESLNSAVAASLLCFEWARRRASAK